MTRDIWSKFNKLEDIWKLLLFILVFAWIFIGIGYLVPLGYMGVCLLYIITGIIGLVAGLKFIGV